MDTQKIALLLEVIRCGSLKRAAESLNYTLSGLMYQINTLEQEIGIPLLVRNHRGVALTPAGMALEPKFRELVESASGLKQEIDALTESGSNKLRIGVLNSVLNSWLPPLLHDYMESHPKVSISIFSGLVELPAWLDSELIDLAIVPNHMAGKYDWLALRRDKICACIPVSFPIAAQETVTCEDLKPYCLLNLSYYETNMYNELYQKLGYNCKGGSEGIRISSTDGSTLLPLVGAGLGVAFLPDSYRCICPDGVRMVPLDPPFRREIGIITRAGRKPAPTVRSFISYLSAAVAD